MTSSILSQSPRDSRIVLSPPPPSKVDPDAAIDFLEGLFADLPPDFVIVLGAFPPGKKKGGQHVHITPAGDLARGILSFAEVKEWIRARDAESCAIYWSLSGHDHEAAGATRSKKSVRWVGDCVEDFDFFRTGGHAAKNLPPDFSWVETNVLPLVPKPSLVIHSGGGIYFIWRIDPPVVGADAAKRFATISEAIHGRVAAIFDAAGFHLDNVSEASHLFRLPGTINYKVDGDPRPAYVAYADWERYYDPGELVGPASSPTADQSPPSSPAPTSPALELVAPPSVPAFPVCAPAAPKLDGLTTEQAGQEVRRFLLNYAKSHPYARDIVDRILAGQALETGHRDNDLQALCSWMGYAFMGDDPTVLAAPVQPTLDAMETENPDDFFVVEEIIDKIERAQSDAHRAAAVKAEQDRGISEVFERAASASHVRLVGRNAIPETAASAEPPTPGPEPVAGEILAPAGHWPTVDRASGLPIEYISADESKHYARVTHLLRDHVLEDATTGRLGIVRPDDSGIRFQPLKKAELRNLIAERVFLASGCKAVKGELIKDIDGELVPVRVHPQQWLVDGIFDASHRRGYRQVRGVAESEIFDTDGSVIDAEGYHDKSGFVVNRTYAPYKGPMSLRDARDLIEELICDFQFETPSHKSAWIASLLTPFARRLYFGCSPVTYVTASIEGAGKGLLVQIIWWLASGRDFGPKKFPRSDEELDKFLVACCLEKRWGVVFDNLKGTFGGEAFEGAVTSEQYDGRLLGENTTVTGTLPTLFYATGNGATITADMARRINGITISSEDPEPETRTSFRHPQLKEWVLANRGNLIAAILTIVRTFLEAGRKLPEGKKLVGFGRFESWNNLICGAVVNAGWEDPGLARRDFGQSASPERSFPGRWLSALEAAGFVGAENGAVVAVIAAAANPIGVQLPTSKRQAAKDLAEICAEDPAVSQSSAKDLAGKLSGAFRRLANRPVQGDSRGFRRLAYRIKNNQRIYFVEYYTPTRTDLRRGETN